MTQPSYTVYVRVPMPRGDFVDPPPVNWNSNKDEALWKVFSGASQTEIDWSQAAELFDVPVDFLLQKVAYLTDRHASQVRAQVRKATAAAKGSAAPSPVPGAEPATSAGQRTTSAQSARRDSPMPRGDVSSSGTPSSMPMRPSGSREASVSTSMLKDAIALSARIGTSTPNRAVDQGAKKRISSAPVPSTTTAKSLSQQQDTRRSQTISPGPAESSSDDSSEEGSSPAQSRIIRRPPRFQQPEAAETYQNEDGDGSESEPAFHLYQPTEQSGQDMGSTLKGDGPSNSRRGQKGSLRDFVDQSHTSDDSSMGSPAVVKPKAREAKPPGPLSPRRGTEIAEQSPSGKVKAMSREGSDGTPSMGSSFSDLDDSVSQSALEEALASHMDRPGASSRFSISQAFRSRYNPGLN